MTEQAKVPAIRFAGFTDPWEQRKLGELSSEFQSGDFISAEKILASGPYPVYGGNGLRGYAKRYNHDGFYALIGRQGALCGNVNTAVGKAYFTEHAVAIKANSLHDTRFLVHLLRCMDLGQYSGQSAQPGLAVGVLKEVETTVPSKVEQQAIGSFFSRLDSLITLHQRKYDKLVIFKKSMLEKMFPKDGESVPEIRFAGFTDPWEQRKLGEVAHFINGRAYSQNELLFSGKYPVLRVGNFYTNDSWYYSNLELEDKNYAYEGDLLYTWSATFGPHIWHGNKVIYHYHIWKVQLEAALEKLFAFQLLERDKERILSDKNGSTMVHITKTGIENTSVLMSCSVEEQRRIGAFFDHLDSIITLHQRKLELLQNIKKSLLDKMFV